jgi:hypothetical protein
MHCIVLAYVGARLGKLVGRMDNVSHAKHERVAMILERNRYFRLGLAVFGAGIVLSCGGR